MYVVLYVFFLKKNQLVLWYAYIYTYADAIPTDSFHAECSLFLNYSFPSLIGKWCLPPMGFSIARVPRVLLDQRLVPLEPIKLKVKEESNTRLSRGERNWFSQKLPWMIIFLHKLPGKWFKKMIGGNHNINLCLGCWFQMAAMISAASASTRSLGASRPGLWTRPCLRHCHRQWRLRRRRRRRPRRGRSWSPCDDAGDVDLKISMKLGKKDSAGKS